MEPDPFKDKILTIGFCATLIPEVIWECTKDAANWAADRILDAMVLIDDNIQEF